MARELGITVTTAEFVSDEEIYMIVTSLGITNSQGYFIGRATETLQQRPDCIGILT
jgi:EAL domain-containing protein (putative c-di-GMP-specific phosphodiesterase class I)